MTMAFLRTHKNNILVTLFFLCLFAVVSTLQYKYDTIVHPTKVLFTTETRYVMPVRLVKNLSFGFDNVLADFYWVSAIQDFAIWDGKDPFYLREYENISALDPNFSYPYLLGILTFTSKGNVTDVEKIEPIANIGMKTLPDDWEIPFYLGTAFQLTKAPSKAVPYLKIAAEKPLAPEMVKKVYQTYLKNILMGTDAATPLIKTIYDTTSSKTTKKIVEESLLLNAMSAALTAIVEDYKVTYGRFPTSLDELIRRNLVRESTELKRKYTITINQRTGEVSIVPKSSN